MSDTQTYTDITQAVFDCVRTNSEQQHGTVYSPPDANAGTTMTEGSELGIHWHVKLQFNFDPTTGILVYTLLDKSSIVPESKVWSGIADGIKACQSQ